MKEDFPVGTYVKRICDSKVGKIQPNYNLYDLNNGDYRIVKMLTPLPEGTNITIEHWSKLKVLTPAEITLALLVS